MIRNFNCYQSLTAGSPSWLRHLLHSFFFVLALILQSPRFALAEAVSQPSAHQSVGVVSLVLGEAYLFSDQKKQQISRGLQIFVGDRIYTEANGHVHVRFIDEGLVSVRPGSALSIERYDFDSARPARSAVKFTLSEGVARSISGKAAKNARQRFRLNTPVAAIGVRGTDFVVSASSEHTRALVNEGAIIMAPFSDACSADSLGPCSENAVELAGNSLEVIEFDGSALLPVTEPLGPSGQFDDLRERFRLADDATQPESDNTESSDASAAYLERAASDQVIEASLSVVGQEAPDYTPTALMSDSELANAQLVWGRFSSDDSAELIAVERITAASNRNITVAAGGYLLYRTELEGVRLDSGLGVVGFNLDSAQAFYNTVSGAAMLQVSGGTLDVDFINDEFLTTLNFDHPVIGPLGFSGGGRVATGGYLIGYDASKSIVGAVSVDAREAGYFFEQGLDGGSISGLTLWGSQ